MSKLSRLTKWLHAQRTCPCCGAGRIAFDQEDPELYEFSHEALYDCGARLQLHPDQRCMLRAVDGCPQAISERCDEIEQEAEEEEEQAEEEEGAS